MIFCNFCYYFWGQHCWWTETNVIGNVFFVFYKFPLPSTFLLPPLPYRCSSVPEYACCVNKLRQNIGLQTWIWRHKQRISSNNDHHRPTPVLEFGGGTSNQAVAPGITRPLHATALRNISYVIVVSSSIASQNWPKGNNSEHHGHERRKGGSGGQGHPWILKISAKKVVFLISSGKKQISPLLAHPYIFQNLRHSYCWMCKSIGWLVAFASYKKYTKKGM